LWEGTPIEFATSLDRVDPARALFQDGRATARLCASPTIGKATVTAASGTIDIKAIKIEIGTAVRSLLLTASRTSLPVEGESVTLRAAVLVADTNAVPGVPMVFSAAPGVLSSQGRQVLTNDGGIAKDVLTTDANSTVTARAADKSDVVDIRLKDVTANKPPTADSAFSSKVDAGKTLGGAFRSAVGQGRISIGFDAVTGFDGTACSIVFTAKRPARSTSTSQIRASSVHPETRSR
jgi:hypothetical protein